MGASAHTVRAYREDMEAYLRWAQRAGVDPLAPTYRQLRRYLAELDQARYARTTIKRHLSSLRTFFRWACVTGLAPADPASVLSAPKVDRRLPKVVSDGDVERLLAVYGPTDADGAPREQTAAQMRDAALLEFLFSCCLLYTSSELRAVFPEVQIWAAEPEHAALLSGGAIGTHVQMGIGDGILPAIMDTSFIDGIVVVTDEEALACARRLAREEGLFCGISSGTNVAAALRLARKLGPDKTVVTLAPDTDVYKRQAYAPLNNNVVSGQFMAASTFKAFTSLAGLEYGFATEGSSWNCTGKWDGFGTGDVQRCRCV